MDEMLSKQINRLRKEGRLQEAWDVGTKAVKENPDDKYIKGAFFWVCYDYLKKVQNSITLRVEKDNGDNTPNPKELKRINHYLDCIIYLNIPPGGYEYRSLLLSFQKNMEFIPKLVLLLVKYSDKLFEDEDKQPFENQKGESPSLMLKFSRKVAKAWMANEEVRKELSIDYICQLFSWTRQKAKDKQHKIWLDYDEAKCLIRAKQFDQARDCALAVLRRKQTEPWAWGALATTYLEEDPDAAIVLFSQALCCARDEVFALPTLKGFARLLAEQNFDNEASMCVKRAVNCYDEKGWNIKDDLEELMSQSWYQEEVDLESLPSFLEKHAATALDFLYEEQEKCIAVVKYIHRSGKGFNAYLNRDQSIAARLSLYRSKKPPSPGDYVRLTLSAEDQSVVIAAEPSDSENMDDVGYQEGTIRITDKGYGFVDDTYVPKNLVQQDIDGQKVRVLRILDFDKKKNRHSWKALTIEEA